jgi:hypothetical protein
VSSDSSRCTAKQHNRLQVAADTAPQPNENLSNPPQVPYASHPPSTCPTRLRRITSSESSSRPFLPCPWKDRLPCIA